MPRRERQQKSDWLARLRRGQMLLHEVERQPDLVRRGHRDVVGILNHQLLDDTFSPACRFCEQPIRELEVVVEVRHCCLRMCLRHARECRARELGRRGDYLATAATASAMASLVGVGP